MNTALPTVDKKKCILCGDCIDICPHQVFKISKEELEFINPEDCTFCTLCEQICEPQAIRCEFAIVAE